MEGAVGGGGAAPGRVCGAGEGVQAAWLQCCCSLGLGSGWQLLCSQQVCWADCVCPSGWSACARAMTTRHQKGSFSNLSDCSNKAESA